MFRKFLCGSWIQIGRISLVNLLPVEDCRSKRRWPFYHRPTCFRLRDAETLGPSWVDRPWSASSVQSTNRVSPAQKLHNFYLKDFGRYGRNPEHVNNTNLVVKEVKGHLQSDGLHIGFIECARDVHVQVEKLISSILDQFNFQFGQQLREPLETLLVAINPDEIHL